MADIYFCGSIRGGRQDAEIYARIIKMLGEHGQVLTEHVGSKDIGEKGMEKPCCHMSTGTEKLLKDFKNIQKLISENKQNWENVL